MTYKEFLDQLRKTPRDWTVDCGRIRGVHMYHCPISAVSGGDMAHPYVCASALGLDLRLATQIAESADGLTYYPDVRADLLEACGLKESV